MYFVSFKEISMYDFKSFEMSFSQYCLFTCIIIQQQIPFKCPICTYVCIGLAVPNITSCTAYCSLYDYANK